MQFVTSRFLQIEGELGCFLFDTFECNSTRTYTFGNQWLSKLKMMVLNNSIIVVLVALVVSTTHLLASTIACTSTLFVVVHVAASVTSTTLFASSFALAIDNLEQNCMHMYSDAPLV